MVPAIVVSCCLTVNPLHGAILMYEPFGGVAEMPDGIMAMLIGGIVIGCDELENKS